THQVYTGVAVVLNGVERSGVECTDVSFSELDDETISRYIATGEPMDKAGAYAIQGRGAVLIRSICGCYSNVIGLPIYRLSEMLEEFGIRPLSNV
ncbi:MAG: Maf family protein, partial [Armatimonadetes bacterium]|nr:Maf family protein [Armatimonadota bacterium]